MDTPQTMEPARVLAQKYCDLVGATYALVEPYMIASYLAGVVEHAESAVKDIASVALNYRNQLRLAVADVYQRRSTRVGLQDAMGALIETFAPRVFAEGMQEGGADPDEMEDEERDALQAWIDNQLTYVPAFTEAVDNAETDQAQESILNRLDLWSGALRNLGDMGKAFALKNRTGQWRLGGTIEHCSTCTRLSNGRPRRVSWYIHNGYIPRQVGSETLECKGFQCLCGVYDPKTDERLL